MWPNVYCFGSQIGRIHQWFAWRPVRLWYGKWVWLRMLKCVVIHKHSYLDGPDWQFWSYDIQSPKVTGNP